MAATIASTGQSQIIAAGSGNGLLQTQRTARLQPPPDGRAAPNVGQMQPSPHLANPPPPKGFGGNARSDKRGIGAPKVGHVEAGGDTAAEAPVAGSGRTPEAQKHATSRFTISMYWLINEPVMMRTCGRSSISACVRNAMICTYDDDVIARIH